MQTPGSFMRASRVAISAVAIVCVASLLGADTVMLPQLRHHAVSYRLTFLFLLLMASLVAPAARPSALRLLAWCGIGYLLGLAGYCVVIACSTQGFTALSSLVRSPSPGDLLWFLLIPVFTLSWLFAAAVRLMIDSRAG